jgi:hypothetical protein
MCTVHLGSGHSRASACSAERPSSLGVLVQPRKQGRGIPPPDAGGSPVEFDQPAVVGRRENGLGVTPVDGDLDLGRRAVGGSPWWACGGDVDRAEGYAGEVVGRRWLARLVRMESNPELGRCYWWGRWGWRSTRGGGRRWPGYGGDGGSSGSNG